MTKMLCVFLFFFLLFISITYIYKIINCFLRYGVPDVFWRLQKTVLFFSKKGLDAAFYLIYSPLLCFCSLLLSAILALSWQRSYEGVFIALLFFFLNLSPVHVLWDAKRSVIISFFSHTLVWKAEYILFWFFCFARNVSSFSFFFFLLDEENSSHRIPFQVWLVFVPLPYSTRQPAI